MTLQSGTLLVWLSMFQSTADADEAEAAKLARAAVAEAAGVDASDVDVESVRGLDWPDASLGCAVPESAYAQVVTPGYRIVTRVARKRYDVHVGAGRAVVCDYLRAPQGPKPPPRSDPPPAGDKPAIPLPEDAGLRRLVDDARDDLAERLSIDPDTIGLTELEELVWPDTSLGCPRPGMRYPQLPQDGLRLELSAGGRLYAYHSGGTRGPFLCESAA